MSFASTQSLKWRVAAVPDGAGGSVVVWEENRGRRVCCRDTRDIYAQRLNPSGQPLWGADDVKVAVEEAGEEILGVLPEDDGGAFVVWHRGGALLVSALDEAGRCVQGMCGNMVIDAGPDSELCPPDCLAVSPDGSRALVSFAIHDPPERSGAWLLPLERGEKGWKPLAPFMVTQAAVLRSVSVAACGNRGWLLHYWAREGKGADLTGLWLSASGTPTGRPFLIVREKERRYINAQAAGVSMADVPPASPAKQAAGVGGTNAREAFLIWSAVDPENMGKEHEVMAARIRGKPDGSARIEKARVCTARTFGMYIPSTMVGIGGSSVETPATPETVAWRRTSTLLPIGKEILLVGALAPDGPYLHRISFPGGVKTVKMAGQADPGFSIRIAPLERGRFMVLWAERQAGGARILGRDAVPGDYALATDGEAVMLADDPGGGPRMADLVALPGDGYMLVFSDSRRSECAFLKAQKFAPAR